MKKKNLLLMMLTLITSVSFADNNTYITVNNSDEPGRVRVETETYVLGSDGFYRPVKYPEPVRTDEYRQSEWKFDEWRQKRKSEEKNSQVGLITRFGYAYNYDAFTYGFSLLYHWDGALGVTLGFDGYSMNGKSSVGYKETIITNEEGEPVFDDNGNLLTKTEKYVKDLGNGLPLWDARFGIEFGKYFILGGLLGKSSVDDQVILDLKGEDAWFINNSESNFMYGGFVTFILPICSYVGLNMDFAVTNKTGFNVAAGINFTLPLKK